MHNVDLILTITGGLAAALLLGYGTHRLGLSPIVGYLLAGIVVGPNTPGFVANRDLAEQLAEIGVMAEQIDREKERLRTDLFGSPLTIEVLLPPPQRPAVDEEQVVDQSQPSTLAQNN